MLKISAIVIALLIGTVLIMATLQRDQLEIERAIKIKGSPSTVFRLINDLKQWEAWSPWAKIDPEMTQSYSGAQSGVGAKYEWSGNSDVGSGRMEITDMSPPSSVELKLEFLKPMKAQNTVVFSLEEEDGYTNTTWSMRGPMPFTSKLFSLFVDMDTMIGGDFESGLKNLKMLAEQ